MRSNLLKFASALALLAAVAFVAAGSAVAQEGPKVSGGVYAGFGQLSWDTGKPAPATPGGTAADKPSDSTYNAQIEANLIVSGKSGTMDYYYRLRVRGTAGDPISKGESEGSANCNGDPGAIISNGSTPGDIKTGIAANADCGKIQTSRVRVGWEPTENFRLEAGRLPSIGGQGYTDIQPVRAPSNFRHYNDNYAFFDVTGVVAAFKMPGIKVGLGLASNCDVSCSGTIVTKDTTTFTTYADQQSTLVFFQGAFGDLKIGARIDNASSKVSTVGDGAATDNIKIGDQGKGSATVVEAQYAIPGAATIAFEYESETDKALATGAKDTKITQPSLAVSFLNGNAAVQYSSSTKDTGATGNVNKAVSTVISAFYLADVGGGKVGAEYVTASQKSGGNPATETTAKGSLIRLLMKADF